MIYLKAILNDIAAVTHSLLFGLKASLDCIFGCFKIYVCLIKSLEVPNWFNVLYLCILSNPDFLGRSFLMSNESESLLSLFKKEHRERFALGPKKGEKLCITVKNKVKTTIFFCFLRIKRANHERITHIALFKEHREGFALVTLL